MEQATRGRAHLERILLVCGMPNAGKSRLSLRPAGGRLELARRRRSSTRRSTMRARPPGQISGGSAT